MKKLCNYFETMFDTDTVNPFSQFVKSDLLTKIKSKVREKMEKNEKGELVFTEEDEISARPDPPK